jgi:hypothetical protein
MTVVIAAVHEFSYWPHSGHEADPAVGLLVDGKRTPSNARLSNINALRVFGSL